MDQSELEEKARENFETKKSISAEENSYYEAKIETMGLKTLERLIQFHPNPSKLMKKGVTFAHQDLETVVEAIGRNKPWSVICGLNPSGPLHLGHKMIFDELLWLQQQGAEVYIPITNDESYVVGKSPTLADSRRIAYDSVIPSIIAMGFDSKKTHIYVMSDYPEIYNVAMDLSKHTNLNRIFGVFGFGKDEVGENPGTLFYRGAVQLAQILLPQFEEFGGPQATLINVGVDQYPYLLLSRDVARKKGFVPPSAIFTKFLPGLSGTGKMTSSRIKSSIFLTDSLKDAEKKLKKAYTGGSILADFQRENGGVFDICPIYNLRANHFEPEYDLKDRCSSGDLLCGYCKKDAITEVLQYLSEHQAKLEDAKSRIDEYLLKTPIRSIL